MGGIRDQTFEWPGPAGMGRLLAAWALSFVLLATGGCNLRNLPELGTVSGVVTLDGKPVSAATVRFQPAVGRGSRARTRQDGSYELVYVADEKGALVGEHQVTISTQWMEEDPSTGVIVSHPETLPAKYNAESKLARTVERGHNVFNFELTSESLLPSAPPRR